ncbi:MAG: hypothetical protein R3C11_13460 [Planctomycetaceae bacterium]
MEPHYEWMPAYVFPVETGLSCLIVFVRDLNFPCQEEVTVESLIQADPVLFISCDGIEKHREAYEQTAAYKALYESGLFDAVMALVDQFGESGAFAKEVGQHLIDHGGTFAINMPRRWVTDSPGNPGLTRSSPFEARLKELLQQFAESPDGPPVAPEEIELKGRKVFRFVFAGTSSLRFRCGPRGNI